MTFMDIIQKIRNSEADLTESERKVCRKILEDPSIVTMYTISQIAMMADTSTAASVSASGLAARDTKTSGMRS